MLYRIFSTRFPAVGVALALTIPAMTYAVAGPAAQDAPSSLPVAQQPHSPDQQQTVSAAFLGVGVSPLTSAAQQNLDLPAGTGLNVESVAEQSPAAAAGLLQGDVLLKLNDQLLINPPQLAVLVRTYQPGEKVKLTIIRDGQTQTLEATLMEKQLPALTAQQGLQFPLRGLVPFNKDRGPVGGEPFAHPRWDEFFEPFRQWQDMDELDRAMPNDWPDVSPLQSHRRMLEKMLQQLREQHRQFNQLQQIQPAPDTGQVQMQSSVTVVDDDHRLEMKRNNDETHLKITTRDGEVIYDGVMPDAEELNKLPQAVRTKVERLRNMSRIQVNVRHGSSPPARSETQEVPLPPNMH